MDSWFKHILNWYIPDFPTRNSSLENTELGVPKEVELPVGQPIGLCSKPSVIWAYNRNHTSTEFCLCVSEFNIWGQWCHVVIYSIHKVCAISCLNADAVECVTQRVD